jgi:MoaA/NifB/PqqE/SkfB family radical SAM enzyme
MRGETAVKPEFLEQHCVHLTLLCNERCLFCSDGDRLDGSVKPMERVVEELEMGRSLGRERIGFSGGGEPTLHPSFHEAISAAKRLGYRDVHLTTNGRRMASKEFVDKAVEAGLESVTFSLHGHTSELNDLIVGAPGAFVQSVQGLKNAVSHHPKLRTNVQMVLNRINAGHAGEMLRYFKSLGCPNVAFKQMLPFGWAWTNREQLFPREGEPVLALWEHFERSDDAELRSMARDYLAVHTEQIVATARGFSEVLSPFVEQGRRPDCWGERCRVCPLRPICADIDRLHSDGRLESLPADPGCGYAPAVLPKPRAFEKAGAALGGFLDYFVAHRWRIKGRACGGCPKDSSCSGAVLDTVLEMGFPRPPSPLRDGEYVENGRRKLKNLEINPGRLCNNKCVFCMSGEERDVHEPWANPERMKDEIRRHYEDGTRSLGFLGGEPSAYPFLLDCMRYARGLGYQRIALCTNGVRLAQPRFLEEALSAGLTRVTMSLHSHIPEIEERLVGVPGILAKKIQAVKNLVAARDAGRLPDNVSLNPVLCRPNAPHIEDFARFFKSLGVEDIRFNFIWPQSRVLKDKNVIPRFSETAPHILRLILKNERELRMSIGFGAVPVCVLPAAVRRSLPLLQKYFFDEALDLPTDVSFLHPDAKGTVERFNWHRRGRDDYRTKIEACSGCRFDPACMGIYRTYLGLYGEAEFGRRED